MAAQFKMAATTAFSSESYILMLNSKIFSGLPTLTNYLTFMEDFFSQKFKMALKFSFPRIVTE
jgi:hypothetical protein